MKDHFTSTDTINIEKFTLFINGQGFLPRNNAQIMGILKIFRYSALKKSLNLYQTLPI